jgi:hypothetical protein
MLPLARLLKGYAAYSMSKSQKNHDSFHDHIKLRVIQFITWCYCPGFLNQIWQNGTVQNLENQYRRKFRYHQNLPLIKERSIEITAKIKRICTRYPNEKRKSLTFIRLGIRIYLLSLRLLL